MCLRGLVNTSRIGRMDIKEELRGYLDELTIDDPKALVGTLIACAVPLTSRLDRIAKALEAHSPKPVEPMGSNHWIWESSKEDQANAHRLTVLLDHPGILKQVIALAVRCGVREATRGGVDLGDMDPDCVVQGAVHACFPDSGKVTASQPLAGTVEIAEPWLACGVEYRRGPWSEMNPPICSVVRGHAGPHVDARRGFSWPMAVPE